ncbi:hypothetical protein LOTGIDRAFT_176768, partial [Lottia gigantea]
MSKEGNFLIFLSLLICFQQILADECVKTSDPCICQTTSRKINFKDLDLPANDYKFKISGTGKAATQLFYYNPCLNFSFASCQDATVCQQDGTAYYKLGDVNIGYS